MSDEKATIRTPFTKKIGAPGSGGRNFGPTMHDPKDSSDTEIVTTPAIPAVSAATPHLGPTEEIEVPKDESAPEPAVLQESDSLIPVPTFANPNAVLVLSDTEDSTKTSAETSGQQSLTALTDDLG